MAYLALRIHRWVLHGAKAYSTASRSIWGWKQSDRGPAHRLWLGIDPFGGTGISLSQMQTVGERSGRKTIVYQPQKTTVCHGCWWLVHRCVRTSLLLRDTDGRNSFSILSISRTISSNTFFCRSSFTTFTCQTNHKGFIGLSIKSLDVIRKYSTGPNDSYPDFKEGADRFVVARLQVHVTPVFELLDTVAPPQDSVTPSWHTTLSTAGIQHRFRPQPFNPTFMT